MATKVLLLLVGVCAAGCMGAVGESANGDSSGMSPAQDASVTSPPGDGSPSGDGSATPPPGDGSVTPPGDVAFTPGAPGCALDHAAFCETFEEGPTSTRGREGDMDSTRWSVAHMTPGEVTGEGGNVANPVSPAPAPACKASYKETSVYPPYDTLICDASGTLTRQLMTAVAVQPYGSNSYMIRQPFDFAGRTGKIDFDVDDGGGYVLGGGFPEINITQDPLPGTTFEDYHNDEAGPMPSNAITVRFSQGGPCSTTQAFVVNVAVYKEYVPTFAPRSASMGCADISPGAMNHWEIQLSQTNLDVYATDYSKDNGQTFPNFRKVYSTPINLSFTRGYVHVQARNHNTRKYGYGPDAIFHWDNIGFDGPVLPTPLSYEIPDNTTMGTYDGPGAPGAGSGITYDVMNLGYQLQDGTGQKPAGVYDPVNLLPAFQFKNLDTSGIASALLSFNGFFLTPGQFNANTTWGWKYRFNGGTWRSRTLTSAEVSVINNMTIADGGSAGNISMLVNVPIGDLKSGTNTFEILPVHAPMNEPPVIANIDLTLSH